jgi:hypothetical protein
MVDNKFIKNDTKKAFLKVPFNLFLITKDSNTMTTKNANRKIWIGSRSNTGTSAISA